MICIDFSKTIQIFGEHDLGLYATCTRLICGLCHTLIGYNRDFSLFFIMSLSALNECFFAKTLRYGERTDYGEKINTGRTESY